MSRPCRRWPVGDCALLRHSALLTLLVLALCGTATAQTTRGFVTVNGGLQSGSQGFSQDRLMGLTAVRTGRWHTDGAPSGWERDSG